MNAYLRQRYHQWRHREQDRCEVRINKPRMRIRGKVQKIYVAFLGIPYARPPIEHRRFEPPKPLQPVPFYRITPLFRAYKEPQPCVQLREEIITGSEDCLKLNIYTPKKPEDIDELLPVLVYIHGGGFERGSGNLKDGISPNNMIKQGLIFVTINYRLGIFGFLNMRSDNCRGNAGMKDQVMALQWIKDNIVHFKGNPYNITIAGQSAGGSSVNFHMISPLSKGLFQKAIVQAGGVYCPWGYGGHAKDVKLLFKKELNKSKELRHVVVLSLKEKSAKSLVFLNERVAERMIKLEPTKVTVHLRPSVECIEKDAFLPDTPENLIAKAEPVPTIAGITKEEGYLYFHADDDIKFAELVRDKEVFIRFLRQNFRWTKQSAMELYPTFRSKYFPNEDRIDDEEIKHNLATFITDLSFRRFYDNFKIGNLLERGSPSFYVYEFDYYSGIPTIAHPVDDDGNPTIVPRAAQHGDDMFYTFVLSSELINETMRQSDSPEISPDVLEQMERVVEYMSNLCGSFCRDGVPKSRREGGEDFEWMPYTEDEPRYLHIGETLTMRKGRLNEKRWREINEICESVPKVPSLQVSPQTPKKSSCSTSTN